MKNLYASCKSNCKYGKFFISVLLLLSFLAILLPSVNLYAQRQELPDFDEITVTLTAKDIGRKEINILVIEQDAYLPVSDLFNFLAIKNSLSASGDSISGHILNPKDLFSIRKKPGNIIYAGKKIQVPGNDLIFTANEYFLKANYYGEAFGIYCKFNFRSLSISLNTDVDLPFLREKRQELMRHNISVLKNQVKPDTIIKPQFEWLSLGAMDWSITQNSYRSKNDFIARASFGGTLAGGETVANLVFSNGQPFVLKNQFFQWRYVNNDKNLFKQIRLGNVFSPASYAPMPSLLGVQINNSATHKRVSFGTYLVSDFTNPGWIVELYINDVLVNYTKADASGLFTFEIPLVYGNTNVRYKFYGPWGEEKSADKIINVPFTFLPKNKFEYTLTAGKIQDDSKNIYSRATANYGLSQKITIGAGAEYNGSFEKNKLLPFANASVRVGGAIIYSAEFSPGLLFKSAVNLRIKNQLQLEAQLIKYNADQHILATSSLLDKKLTLSMPFKYKRIYGFGQLQYKESKFYKEYLRTAEWLMSAGTGRLNISITNNAFFSHRSAEILSKVSLNIALPYKLRLSPQLQYRYYDNKILLLKVDAEKRLFKTMVATLGYEYNKLFATSDYNVGLRYNFSFAQTSFSARKAAGGLNITNSASGSVLIGKKINNIKLGANGMVSKGIIEILPFLDYNGNGIKDKGEPEVKNLNLRVDGTKVERSFDKSKVIISALESYNKYFIKLDDKNFENPAYQLGNKIIQVTAMPNQVQQIPVPVLIMGEASGYVYTEEEGKKKGIGKLIVNIFDTAQNLVARVITEPDGYFSYLGLRPGNYTAQTDHTQLSKINMKNITGSFAFKVKESKEGDIVDGIELLITMGQ